MHILKLILGIVLCVQARIHYLLHFKSSNQFCVFIFLISTCKKLLFCVFMLQEISVGQQIVFDVINC